MTVALNNFNTGIVVATNSVNDTTHMSVTAGSSNLCAIVPIGYDSSTGLSISAVSYGGNTMVKAGATVATGSANFAYSESWVFPNPPTGLNALVITGSGTFADLYYNLISFKNVNQVTPVRAGTYNTAIVTSATPAITISSNTNDLTFTCINSGGPSITGSSQTTEAAEINTGGGYAMATDRATTPASSVTHTWTLGSSAKSALHGFSINGDPSVSNYNFVPSFGPRRYRGPMANLQVATPQAFIPGAQPLPPYIPNPSIVALGRFKWIANRRQNVGYGPGVPVVAGVLIQRTLMGVGV